MSGWAGLFSIYIGSNWAHLTIKPESRDRLAHKSPKVYLKPIWIFNKEKKRGGGGSFSCLKGGKGLFPASNMALEEKRKQREECIHELAISQGHMILQSEGPMKEGVTAVDSFSFMSLD